MPSEMNSTKPGALDVPETLRRSLKNLAANTYRRGRRGWETPSAPDISFHTITEAKMRNLVEIRHGNGRDRVTLTEFGRELASAVAKRRRAGGDA